MEQRGRKRKRKRDLARAILMTVSALGLITLAAIPANLPAALHKLGMLPTGARDGGVVNRARNRLIKKGLLARKGGYLQLTSRGERFLLMFELHNAARKPKRWDGRWRILIFDIPERKRGLREKIRQTLIGIGFARLQDSVWIYPYDVEDLIALLKADFKVGKAMLYMIVDELEADASLRKYFELSENM